MVAILSTNWPAGMGNDAMLASAMHIDDLVNSGCSAISTNVVQHIKHMFTSLRMHRLTARPAAMSSAKHGISSSYNCVLQWPLCLSLLEDKQIDILPIISHRFGFTEDEVAKGFDTALRSAETQAVKVLFNL